MIPVGVCASEEYVNYYGIEIGEEEYSNLLGLGFTEEEIYHMESDEFNANKNIESALEAITTKYYVDTTRYDSLGRVVYNNVTEVTEQEYNDSGIMTRDASAYVETGYKKMTTTISQAGTKYRYKVTLTWKQMPRVRSYDIIGIGYEAVLVYRDSSIVFNQTHCISNNCTNTNSFIMDYYGLSGTGVSFKLPSSTSITGLRSYFYFDVSKYYDGTLTFMYAYGDYAHATQNVTVNQSTGYYVNQAGIILDSGVINYYDTIPSAEAEWNGNW
jgi:hypothetical protein